MKKSLFACLATAIAAALLVFTPGTASAAIHTEGFDTPVPTGWTAQNNSAAVGSTTVSPASSRSSAPIRARPTPA
ncbi:hypothetical protein [Aeromicrobium sp. UC242_57]|uniref:hypothetical protein n=1 Tax=Aeromicrobium sp. UC242_57 TaxID=3374624 RepID=UPI0037A11FE3